MTYSPWDTIVTAEGRTQPLWRKEARDLARGFSGALFVALPLLYTEEMWSLSQSMPEITLFAFLGVAYLANVGFSMFGGFKPELGRRDLWWDGAMSMGIGVVAGAITLLLISRWDPGTPLRQVVDLIALESIPASFGASLAVHQLGSRYDRHHPQPADRLPPDARTLAGAALGGLLFAFNIAPTIETRRITAESDWWHTLALALFSIAISALMVFFTNFVEGDDNRILRGIGLETAVSYLIALAVSAFLLWVFGYIGLGTPLPLMVKWTVVLGYGTTIGGAAGRLIL